jgi:hypothetical protein
MPLTIRKKLGILTATIVAGATFAGPAQAAPGPAPAPAPPTTVAPAAPVPASAPEPTIDRYCTPSGELTQAFSAWDDFGFYTPVYNAGLEKLAWGWMIFNGARTVDGNEPWYIGGRSDDRSLYLPNRAVAVTPTFCIDETYTHFRFFARGAGELKIDILYFDKNGGITHTDPVSYRPVNSSWAVSPQVEIDLFSKRGVTGSLPVAFRFSTGDNDQFVIDDVYVDPWARH